MFNFKSLVIGSLLTISSIATAATDTVDLSGTVTTTLAVTASEAGSASALDLTPATDRIALVGTIAASTNNEQGLTVATSDGDLTHANGTGTAITYTTAAAASQPLAGAFDGANTASSVAGEFNQNLYIKYSPAQYQDPGTYTGQITVTVSDN